jgi:hypothetical protein
MESDKRLFTNKPAAARGRRPSFGQLFAEAPYDERIELTRQMLAEEPFLNEITLRDVLHQLYRQGIARGEGRRLEEVISALRQYHPQFYDALAGMLLDWRLANALAEQRLEAVAELAREMAAGVADYPATFHDNLERLAYHGHTALLVEIMGVAWPRLQAVGAAVPGSLEGFAARASDLIIYHHLEQMPAPNAYDPELQARLETYLAISPERLDQYMAFLNGDIRAQWRREHFQLPADDADVPPATVQNLQSLTLAFVGYLYREEGVAYSKGDLLRPHIPRYLLDRHSGVLYPREALGDLMRQGAPPPLNRIQPRPPIHFLCPDRETFQRYLDRLLVTGNPQPYRAAALLELMPAWLRYLAGVNLLDTAQRPDIEMEMGKLAETVKQIGLQQPADPLLRHNLAPGHSP